MNESETKMFDLLVIAVEVKEENGETMARFCSKLNEEVLIQMCKEDQESWNDIKETVNNVLTMIETAAKE